MESFSFQRGGNPLNRIDIGLKAVIKNWLDEMGIERYKINKDFTIDIKCELILKNIELNELPSFIQFNKVSGSLFAENNSFTSLRGFPREVAGCYICSHNKLISLEGCPEIVQTFECSHNNLTSLKGAPKRVDNFDCSYNNLTTLEYLPNISWWLVCDHNKLKTLKGCPQKLIGGFNCSNNLLTSLEYAPFETGYIFNCGANNITSLKGTPLKVGDFFYCYQNKLEDLEGLEISAKRGIYCYDNPGEFSEEYVRKSIKVSGEVITVNPKK